MNVNALINRETTRCQDQNTEETASGIISCRIFPVLQVILRNRRQL